MKTLEQINFSNTFVTLGPEFFQIKTPDPVSEPYLVSFSPDTADLIGLNPAETARPDFTEYFSGNKALPGAQPLAMDYAGYQFGVYNSRLGDGRGLLLGEVANGHQQRWDLYLKGCGPTRFARGFDGRATLRSSIREFLGGEAVHGLGIPTTRALAVIGFRELIFREVPEPAAVLIRVADCHIRFGSFENFHYSNRPERVTELADYVIHHHHPDIETANDRYRLFYRSVIQKTAYLIARWQSVGFIHGVMNTDNMSITGATFDYGPFGFMDRFNPEFTPNHTDTRGRYAFGRQPEIGSWNLVRLGEALAHLLGPDVLEAELKTYQPQFNAGYQQMMAEKLGLGIRDSEFKDLVGKLFKLLYSEQADYTNFFRRLSDFPHGPWTKLKSSFKNPGDLEGWLSLYKKLIDREDLDHEKRKAAMDRVNPKFILRNYLLQRVIDKAVKESDFSEIERLRLLLQDPFNDPPEIFSQNGIDPEEYASDTPQPFVEMRLSCSA